MQQPKLFSSKSNTNNTWTTTCYYYNKLFIVSLVLLIIKCCLMVPTTTYAMPLVLPVIQSKRIYYGRSILQQHSKKIKGDNDVVGRLDNCYGIIQQYLCFLIRGGGERRDYDNNNNNNNNDDSKDLTYIIDSFQEQLSKKVSKYRDDTRITFHKLQEDVVRVITKKKSKQQQQRQQKQKLPALDASTNNSSATEPAKIDNKLEEMETESLPNVDTIESILENRIINDEDSNNNNNTNNDTLVSDHKDGVNEILVQVPTGDTIQSSEKKEIEVTLDKNLSVDSTKVKSDDDDTTTTTTTSTTTDNKFHLHPFAFLSNFRHSSTKLESKIISSDDLMMEKPKKSNKRVVKGKKLKVKNSRKISETSTSSTSTGTQQQSLTRVGETLDTNGSYLNSYVKQTQITIDENNGRDPIAITSKQLKSTANDKVEVKKMINALLLSNRSRKIQKFVILTVLYLIVSILVQIIFKILSRRLVFR